MTDTTKLVAFIIVITAAFVYICRAIPQIKSEPVNVETEIGDSPEELVAAGKRIFMSDRAQCLTCHSLGEDPKARCPNQEGLGERAADRTSGLSAAEYMVQSVYDPNAYIVSGYPAKQMTPVNKPPIALSHDEILAVLAFLNTLGGQTDADFVEALREAQEPWRKGLLQPGEGEQQDRLPVLAGDSRHGREVFDEQGCIRCHRLENKGQDIGPELTAIGASQTSAYILESILESSAVIVKGYKRTIVFWKDEDLMTLSGTLLEWVPDKEHPTTLRLAVQEDDAEDDWDFEDEDNGEAEEPDSETALEIGETVVKEIDLNEVAYVGDTIVGVKINGKPSSLLGEYVAGDKDSGLTLAILENGRWVERHVPPEQIRFLNLPTSPMPSNFAELLTPREVYDIIAYLLTQKGGQT